MEYNVIIAGVGGQGVVTLGSVIAESAMDARLNVVMSEIHGLSQRGGSVSVEVRIGDVRSPITPAGAADLILGLESIEAFRVLDKANSNTLVLVNSRHMTPVYLSIRGKEYPDIRELARSAGNTARIHFMDAENLAREAGSERAAGTALLGAALSMTSIPFDAHNVHSALEKRFSGRLYDINFDAFERGEKAGIEVLEGRGDYIQAGKAAIGR